MAKKAKKTAVKKASTKSKTKTTPRGKTAPKAKAKAKPAKATARKVSAKVSTPLSHKPSPSTLRVTEYKLFTEDSVRSLEDQVNYYIKKGWSPVGGVVLQGASTFTQTMVRHDI